MGETTRSCLPPLIADDASDEEEIPGIPDFVQKAVKNSLKQSASLLQESKGGTADAGLKGKRRMVDDPDGGDADSESEGQDIEGALRKSKKLKPSTTPEADLESSSVLPASTMRLEERSQSSPPLATQKVSGFDPDQATAPNECAPSSPGRHRSLAEVAFEETWAGMEVDVQDCKANAEVLSAADHSPYGPRPNAEVDGNRGWDHFVVEAPDVEVGSGDIPNPHQADMEVEVGCGSISNPHPASMEVDSLSSMECGSAEVPLVEDAAPGAGNSNGPILPYGPATEARLIGLSEFFLREESGSAQEIGTSAASPITSPLPRPLASPCHPAQVSSESLVLGRWPTPFLQLAISHPTFGGNLSQNASNPRYRGEKVCQDSPSTCYAC